MYLHHHNSLCTFTCPGVSISGWSTRQKFQSYKNNFPPRLTSTRLTWFGSLWMTPILNIKRGVSISPSLVVLFIMRAFCRHLLPTNSFKPFVFVFSGGFDAHGLFQCIQRWRDQPRAGFTLFTWMWRWFPCEYGDSWWLTQPAVIQCTGSLFKGDIQLIFGFIILFWVVTRIGLHALMLKNASVFSVFSVPHCLRCPVSSFLFKAPFPHTQSPSDWSAHTRLSQHCSLCLGSALLCFQLHVSFTSTMNIGINYANAQHDDAVWCHKFLKLKVDLLTKRLRHFGSVFSVGERSFCLCRL